MSPKLTKFVDSLPRMELLEPIRNNQGKEYYEVRMEEYRKKLHRDLPHTRDWGYNRSVPGPLINVNQGEPIQVKWMNNLPSRHLLPVDKSVHDMEDLPEVRTVTHLHGGETRSASDGYPEAWFTKGFEEVGPFFKQKV